jgi:hypothetical protein
MNTLKYCKELIEDEDDEGTISELAEIISELEDEENND